MAGSQTFTLNIKALFDASDVKAKVGDIQSSLSKLKLPDKLGVDLNKSFAGVNKALDDFISRTEKGIKTKSDASSITKSFENVTKELNNLDNLMVKIKGQLGDGVDLSKIIKFDGSVKEKLESINNEIKSLQQQINSINTNKLQQLQNALSQIKSKGALNQGNKALELFKQGDLEGSLQVLSAIISKLEALKTANKAQGHNTTNLGISLDALRKMYQTVSDAQRETANLTEKQNAKVAEGAQVARQAADDYAAALNKDIDALHRVSSETSGLAPKIRDLAAGQAQFVREVDQVKSRIQYFFGLTNAINLVKRAIRGAVETIKDLDKAMTATAVVTDFTVSDMWKQLPEYTKRANELGVTTQAAYEAATLYYQQGLDNDEVNALSVETLKMARIAGLDAAEATDRMTNALRGFNMALDAQSAQRVDDVYSELAANTASNVDEISTAMTKVASLAHSANMEFETTAAFLAQIIETTRESAETAGTALKTVVARFSEVKKLVDTNQLKGQDEEGQAVDVNKVSAALRTAGIDLNKYFLGEVELDDILMELASKWDSLTSVQQRYIATQAAGSRQQSRFIALMQDYARMQELVGKAYNSEGASAKQFAKTQESLESKLARLKNAWNEFLMGLTNNVMVKTFVDLLTNLLNLVNNLTGAFGDGAGSILKWVLALSTLSGLRRLFVDGGLATQLISGIMGHSLGANKLRVSMGRGFFDEAGQYQNYTRQQLRDNRGPTFIGGVGSLGKKAWGGMQKLGHKFATTKLGYSLGMSTEGLFGAAGASELSATTAGVVGLTTAIVALTAAVTAGVLAYQAWLKFTPEGRIKAAKNNVKEMEKEAKQAQETANALQSLQDTYNKQTQEIEEATTLSDKKNLIQKRNEAILEAINKNPDYTQFLEQDFTTTGELVLTLNADKVTDAAVAAAGDVTRKTMAQYYAQAMLEKAMAEAIPDTTYDVDSSKVGYWGGGFRLGEERPNDSEKLVRKQGHYEAEKRLLALSYGSGLSDLNITEQLGADFTNALSKALAQISFDTGEAFQYEDLDIIAKAFSSNKVSTNLAKALAAENFDFSLANFSFDENVDIETQDFSALYEALNITENDLIAFGKTINKDSNYVKKLIGTHANQIKQLQVEQRNNLKQKFTERGIIPNIDQWSPTQIASATSVINQINDELSNKGQNLILESLNLTTTTEEISQIQAVINSLNFDDPISSFQALQSAAHSTIPVIKDLGENLLKSELGLSDTAHLVQSYFVSDEYENISEEIQKIIETNESLGATDVQKLAKNNSKLNTLLKEGVINAQGLANALTLVGNGSLSFDQLTNSVINALEQVETFEGMMRDVHNFIADFDEGMDYGEGIDFLTEKTKSLKDLLDNWEFGNERSRNIYEMLFGTNYMDDWKNGDDYIRGRVTKFAHWLENDGYNFFDAFSGKLGIKSDKKGHIDWDITSQFKDINDMYTQVAKMANISENAAKMLIGSFASHGDYDFVSQLEELSQKGAINSIVDKYGKGKTFWRESDLKAIAESVGLGVEELKELVNKEISKQKLGEGLETDFEGFKPGDLLKSFQQDLQVAGQDYSTFIQNFINDRQLDVTHLRAALSNLGFSGEDLNALVQEIQDSLTQTGDIDKDIKVPTDVSAEIGEVTVSDEYVTQVEEAIQDKTPDNVSATTNVTVTTSNVKSSNVSPEVEDTTITQTIETEVDNTNVFSSADEAAEYLYNSIVSGESDGATEGSAVVTAELDNSVSSSEVQSILAAKLTSGAVDSAGSISSTVLQAVSGQTYTITVYANVIGLPESAGAAGGIVKSYAKGSAKNSLSPGLALTGEEGPEIVWNKEGGYAYVTGEQGAEFQALRAGDRVFNAQETRKIMRNSSFAKGGIVDSYAAGRWKTDSGKKSSGGGGGGGGSGKEEKEDEWKNELDWLYNLMEDIVELERDQKAIEEQYEDYLKDQSKTGKDLYNLLIKQLGNLYTQLNHQTFALEKREQEMREFMDVTNDKDKYLWYNWKDRTLEIDWDAIDKIKDEEEYKHIKELIDEAEEIQDKMDDADDAIMDITNQIQELENIWRDTFTDFEQRVYDAIVKSYQQVIDEYSELNDTLNNSNQQILDSLQKQISLSRQIRDNTKTEEEISDNEARLAYLRRDTSSGNDLAALQLEKELSEQRQNYEDTLVDQAVNRLQEDNDAAAQQRQQQIDIMQAQLDYQSQNGEFNAAVRELLESAMGADGELLTNSDLVTLLKEQENWAAMSDVSKTVWDEELNGTFKEVAAFLLKQNAEENGTFYTALTAAVKSVSTAIGSYSQAMTKLGDQISGAGSSGGGGGGGGGASSQSATVGTPKVEIKQAVVWERPKGVVPNGTYTNWQGSRYATGGLNTKTGPAWLDGTPSEPEYVLNARQTDAFLKLADVLPSMMGSGTNAQTNTFGSTYVNLSVNLDSVSPDYDVDRMVDLLKDKLYDAGSYRNVNSLSFIR